jgi:hypothetical protein
MTMNDNDKLVQWLQGLQAPQSTERLPAGSYNPFGGNPYAYAQGRQAPVAGPQQPNQTPAAGATGDSGGRSGISGGGRSGAIKDAALARQAGLVSQFGQGIQPMDMSATIAAIRARMAGGGAAPQLPPMPAQSTMLGMPQIQAALARRQAATPQVPPAPVV